ncbi:hypothetical protein GW17_00022446 [Ensete ventricosum]|nr:hypothetical protein GW17_00022446 [Ensete ventricosum]RZR84885.1 hypothetical protein BHM03_00011776 [Ensete ventricosum]
MKVPTKIGWQKVVLSSSLMSSLALFSCAGSEAAHMTTDVVLREPIAAVWKRSDRGRSDQKGRGGGSKRRWNEGGEGKGRRLRRRAAPSAWRQQLGGVTNGHSTAVFYVQFVALGLLWRRLPVDDSHNWLMIPGRATHSHGNRKHVATSHWRSPLRMSGACPAHTHDGIEESCLVSEVRFQRKGARSSVPTSPRSRNEASTVPAALGFVFGSFWPQPPAMRRRRVELKQEV